MGGGPRMKEAAMATTPSRPSVNHLVIQCRDIEASNHFYTDVLGFEQCGTLTLIPGIDMRFYRGDPDHHHDLALVQVADPASAPPVEEWDLITNRPGLAHVALCYGTREEWLA